MMIPVVNYFVPQIFLHSFSGPSSLDYGNLLSLHELLLEVDINNRVIR